MAGFKLNFFSGLKPRLPDHLLQPGEATIAQNCDFAYGELRNTKGPFEYLTLANAPRGLYTDDGITFYSWAEDVSAVRSPFVNDTFSRLYYSQNQIIRVASRLGTKIEGGPPSTSYRVGVPKPSKNPVVTTSLNVPTHETANISVKFHYESVGVKYQEQAITPTTLSENTFRFTPPAKDSGTPASAFPVLRISANWKSDNKQIFDIYSSNSTFQNSTRLYTLDIAKDAGTGSVTYTATVTLTIQQSEMEARAYVYTYVNIYNEEGPPSGYTITDIIPTFTANVVVEKDNVGDYAPLKEIRIYRTPPGADIENFYYIGSIYVIAQPFAAVTLTFIDNISDSLLNEPLTSYNYYPPPAVDGISLLPNGVMIAADSNKLIFSEPYKPWAWPPEYAIQFQHSITGGIVIGADVLITTRGSPYLVSGISPDATTHSKINVDQAGVSKWSLAVVNGIVFYASNDGIVSIRGVNGSLEESQVFFTRDVWRQKYGEGLSSMQFAVWDGRLVVFSRENKFTPFMIRFDEAGGTMTELPGMVARCAIVSPLADQFYFANDTKLYQFAGGTVQNATWQSEEKVFDRPLNFSAAQAVVEGNWTIELWAYVKTNSGYEYQMKHSKAVATGTTDFRLPSGFKSDRYKLKISGSGRFKELRIAQSFNELSTL